jgi:glycosyltransferase involved in cell wall biosynthesis/GT2 family glycosyltransferase
VGVRVLRISHSAVVDEWRGRERALSALGVDVEALSAVVWPEGGAPVMLRPRPGERVTGVRTFGTHPALFLYDPVPLWHALRRAPDVLDIHEEPFALATAEVLVLRRLAGCRAPFVLYTAQNLDKRYPVPIRWLERWALRRASGVSACNAEAARIVERKGFAGRARVIPLGIDLERFADASVADPTPSELHSEGDDLEHDKASASQATITVGFLGRLVPEKGLFVLLDAVSRYSRLRARIAGGGPLAGTLHQEIAARGLADRVELLGPIDPDSIAAFYRSVDVVAIPSLPRHGWTEQFGRVAIEAMASGVPVVSSDAGALPDVVADAGIVVPYGDPGALAAALIQAAEQRADDLRRRGYARAAECSWDAVGRQYLDLYRSLEHMPAKRSPGVEIAVVAYGAPELLRQALEPLVSAGSGADSAAPFPVTVVDNSSLPEIAALCEELGVRYLDAGRNGGFAAGVNLALANRLDLGADLLLLNPDARISPDEIVALHTRLRLDPALASIAPEQRDSTGHTARVRWPFPSPANAWLEALGLGRFEGGGTYAIGAVLLLRAEALAQVGGFDERFFLYAEETDWAYRAHLLGWRHAVAHGVQAMHEGAATSTDPRAREVHFHASQERYLRKHFGTVGWQSARVAVWLGAMARSFVLPGERGRDARRRAALYHLGPVRVEARFAPRP